MNRFLLYEEIIEENEKKYKLLAEVVKFRNGKVASSFNLSIPSVFVFDNLDQFASIYCNEKVKLHIVPEKEQEKTE